MRAKTGFDPGQEAVLRTRVARRRCRRHAAAGCVPGMRVDCARAKRGRKRKKKTNAFHFVAESHGSSHGEGHECPHCERE